MVIENLREELPVCRNSNKFEKFCHIAISVVFLLFIAFLAIVSLLHTTGMQFVNAGEGIQSSLYSIREGDESVIYYNDFLYSNIFWLLICAVLAFIIIPRSKKIPVKYMALFISLWTILFGTIWVYSSQNCPTSDSAMVVNASASAASGDYSFMSDDYFNYYSFQLGYVLFNEILIRIHNIFTTTLFIQVINVILLAAIYCALILLNKELFGDNRICALTTVIFAVSLQPMIFTVFTYGVIPGLTFAVWAFYFEIRYLKTDNMVNCIFSSIFIAIAVMIKSNYLIFLIAMVMVMVIKLFSRKQFIEDLSFIIVAVVLSTSLTPIAKYSYETRSNVKLGDSIPYASWISMGLNEAYSAPGWYNVSLTIDAFNNNNRDAKATGEASKKNIKERVKYFAKHPQYTDDFFYKKTVSQWNETSYESIWNNQVREQYKDKGKLASYVCGAGEHHTKRYMDIIAQFVFASSLLGILFCLKNKNILTLIIPITVFGGFLYHTISEGKSQYVLPYYILLLGFAAYGICMLYDGMSGQFKKISFLEKIFTVSDKSKKVAVAADTADDKIEQDQIEGEI